MQKCSLAAQLQPLECPSRRAHHEFRLYLLRAELLIPALALPTLRIGAHGAAHEELGIDRLLRLEVIRHNVAQGVNKQGMVIGGCRPPDLLHAHLLGQLVAVLNVQFVQRLDVLVHEGDGHQNEVLQALLDIALKVKEKQGKEKINI